MINKKSVIIYLIQVNRIYQIYYNVNNKYVNSQSRL